MTQLRISTALEEQDVDAIHRFLAEESTWARGIPLEMVRESMRHSLNFGGFLAGRQVAYARVISDYATFAYLVDVFVLPEHRGKGFAALLMREVMGHPRLQGLRRFMLATTTAHGLYERFGFTPTAQPQSFMERWLPDVYVQDRHPA